jgi:hypothetical protein
VGDVREGLTTQVRAQVSELEVWEAAQLHLLEQAARERLATLGIDASPEIAVALMAVAMLLAEHTEEWGGDARDVLGEISSLGLRLLDGTCPGDC